MLRRYTMDGDPINRGVRPPVELDGTTTVCPHHVAQTHWYDEARSTGRQCSNGGSIGMIVMVVRNQYKVDWRQLVKRHARSNQPFGSGKRYRAGALREDRIGQEGDTIHAHQHR